ncbi:MAG: M1 family metallopeptidase [Proteobacteria bacterium]|nr:M1 family metallopeptidase [Pseudomonadota bacterium]
MTASRMLCLPLLAVAGIAAAADHTMTSGLGMSPEQKAVVFEQADLAFSVDPAAKSLAGDATLTFRAKSPLSRFALEFDPRYAISAFDVDGVALAANEHPNNEGRIEFALPKPVATGGSFKVHIRYDGKPLVAKRAPWDGGIVWATAPTGEPWVATAVEGEGCDLLWPCIDHPMGKPLRVIQHITVPAGLTAASNGRLLSVDKNDRTWTWNWSARQPDTYAIALNIGPYELLQSQYHSRFGNTMPMDFYYLRGNRTKAEGLYAELPKMLDFFEEVVGPYPWSDDKVGVVETPHLGMEHQTINAYGNDYKKDINGYDWLMQHEFAHEWFGNQMTNADYDDFWLHEGFAMYMQPLYLEWLRGHMYYDAEMLRQRGLIAGKHPMVSGHSRPNGTAESEAIDPGTDVYYKGAWILHTLRHQIGDRAFRASMRMLVYGRLDPKPGNFKPRYATSKDYVDAVNRITGKDWNWFFDVYLHSAVMPRLDVERSGGKLKLRWTTDGNRPFPLPVDVRVGERKVRVPMTNGRGEVAIAASESYTVDPDNMVLRDAPEIAVWKADAAARAKAAAEKVKQGKQ